MAISRRQFAKGITAGTVGSLGLLTSSLAQAFPAQVEVLGTVPQGKVPRLIVSAQQGAQQAKITLKRDDGRPFNFYLGNVSAGFRKEIALDSRPGRHQYEGTMTATVEGEAVSSVLSFKTVVATPIKISVNRDKLDLEGRSLEIQTSREVSQLSLKVIGLGDHLLAEESISVSNWALKKPLKITWPPIDRKELLRLEVRVDDADGFFNAVALTPWSVEIPHEEVLFESASATVNASEEPKLKDSLKEISAALERFSQIKGVQLFIAGHTDTVGGAAYNRRLSRKRARSIAAWFVRNRVPVQVFYEGFGESTLKVRTKDEVDEAKNRRVDYILSVEAPSLKGGAWKKL